MPLLAALGVLAIAVTVLAVVLATRSGDGNGPVAAPVASEPTASGSDAPNSDDSQVADSGGLGAPTGDPGSEVTTAPTTLPVTAPAEAPLQTYSASGGITVEGPAGWRRDHSSGLSAVSDYDAPDSSARLAGSTFRIGVGNQNPSDDIGLEGRQAAAFLEKEYDAQIIGGVHLDSFLDTTCADIYYRYYNTTYNVDRSGIERIWHDNGVTYIIQASGPTADLARTRSVFRDLTSQASID